jgi:uncharacterized protein
VVLTGCRQAGKTSLLAKAFPNHTYVSLDVPMVAEEAEHSGEDFLRRHAPPVIIDEVQYGPTLLRHVKADIDRHRDETGRSLIAGSQDFALTEGVRESLAGRSSVLTLHSLSAREYEAWSRKTLDREALVEWMLRGGYPELHSRGLDAERFFGDRVATYLERDVRSILGMRSLRDFDRFMRLCAARTGQLASRSASASGPNRRARPSAGSRSSRHWLAPTASSRRRSSRRIVAPGGPPRQSQLPTVFPWGFLSSS